MRKRRIYLVLVILAVVAVVGVIVTGTFREREPEYGGKRLSEWAEALQTRMTPPFLARPNLPMVMEDVEAAEAIRRIGTNALPFLLQWIRYERPVWVWRTKWNRIVEKALRKPPNWAHLDDRKPRLARGSVLALSELGPEAKTAIPDLSELMNDPSRTKSAAAAATVLTRLGASALPVLVPGLTNKLFAVRQIVLPSFVASGTNAPIPVQSRPTTR